MLKAFSKVASGFNDADYWRKANCPSSGFPVAIINSFYEF
jgi:hypothetical protein